MRKLFFILIVFIPVLTRAQNDRGGIQWTNGLSWEQIKNMAKKENKYIFLDCHATWCIPCKEMERTVFANAVVGDFFNNKFISVRVQMNRAGWDSENVRNWYKDADLMGATYRITGYPCLLFFSPSGTILEKVEGFKTINDLVTIAGNTMKPGHVYKDPYSQYDNLVLDYRNGQKNYKEIPSLIDKAEKLGHLKLKDSLTKDYYKYLNKLKEKDLLSETNIGFIASNIKSRSDKYFSLFYANAKKIDKVMHKEGFARMTVDRVIATEEVDAFMKKIYRSENLIIPDWSKLTHIISQKYNRGYADRAVREARKEYYWRTGNKPGFIQTFMEQLKYNDLDSSFKGRHYSRINVCAWLIFESSNDKDTLNTAINWMEEGLRKGAFTDWLTWDTYSNLLYKMSILHNVNRIDEAIQWEEKVLEGALKEMGEEGGKPFRKYLSLMRKREATW